MPLQLTTLLAGLAAAREPLIIAIDDVPWLDQSSLAALAYALRRLERQPLRLLACARAEPGHVDTPLFRSLAAWDRHELDVGGLTVGAIFEIVHQHLGIRLPRPLLIPLHSESGGNPSFAIEIARALAIGGSERLRPLPIPSSLDDAARSRLRHLSKNARAVLLVASALANPSRDLVLAAADLSANAAAGPRRGD